MALALCIGRAKGWRAQTGIPLALVISLVSPCAVLRRTTRNILREMIEREDESGSATVRKDSSWPEGLPTSMHGQTPTLLKPNALCRRVPGEPDDEAIESVSEDEADALKIDPKIFRQIGLPEVETNKFNPNDFPKFAKALGKHAGKLGDLIKAFPAKCDAEQSQHLVATLSLKPEKAFF